MLFDSSPTIMIDESAGFVVRNDGGDVMPVGKRGIAAAICVCTSTEAPSMLRSSANCSVTFELPDELEEVMSSRPAIEVNCRSSGLATVDAMAPGSLPG